MSKIMIMIVVKIRQVRSTMNIIMMESCQGPVTRTSARVRCRRGRARRYWSGRRHSGLRRKPRPSCILSIWIRFMSVSSDSYPGIERGARILATEGRADRAAARLRRERGRPTVRSLQDREQSVLTSREYWPDPVRSRSAVRPNNPNLLMSAAVDAINLEH